MSNHILRKTTLKILQRIRASRFQKPALRLLVGLHNQSYHAISFFASQKGRHPKHDILQYHRFFLENVKPEDKVLDIGSGTGEIAFKISQKAQTVLGIDINSENIKKSQSAYKKNNLKFIQGDATKYSTEEQFDVIILSNVLEHIENRVGLLKQFALLAPKILIRVPLITRDWLTVFKKNEGFEYRLDRTHHTEYTEAGFRKEISAAGLKISELHTRFGELYAVIHS